MTFFTVDTVYVAIAAAFVAALLHRLYRYNCDRSFPPGPIGMPIVGYLPFLTKQPYVKLQELAKKYGPVFSLRLGSQYVVVLCDFQSIKTAFGSDVFLGGKPDSPFDIDKELEDASLTGKKAKELRRFSIHALKDLGFGKTAMEGQVKEEISDVLERLEDTKGEPTELRVIMSPSISNNIFSLVFGGRLHHTDERRIMLDGILREIGNPAGEFGVLSFFPWLAKILFFFKFGNYGKLQSAFASMKSFVQREVKEHEETLDSNNIRDYIDAFLLQMEKSKSDPDTVFTKFILETFALGLFGAGSDTVRVTMDWILLTMAAFPDVQDKVCKEIGDVIGRQRFPSWSDHLKMPYTEAVIWEVMRWITIAPINLVGHTAEDTTLNSYHIPKDTYVIADHYAVHYDPVLWKEPTSFRPERFLSKDGSKFQKPEYLIPFSIGKRSCPGETFALQEVFLYFTAILQKFEVCLPEGAVPDFEGELGIVLQMKPQKLIVKFRE